MAMRIAINGFGRIGWLVFWVLYIQGRFGKDIDVVVVGDIVLADNFVYLFKYDSIQGKFEGSVGSKKSVFDKVEFDVLVVDGQEIRVVSVKSLVELFWKELGIDLVIESTGLFVDKEKVEGHIKVGAKKVIIIALVKNEDITIVMGVNHEKYDLVKHYVVSNASCIINCLVPIVHVLFKEGFGFIEGLMIIVYFYIVIQKVVDGFFKKDWKGGRSVVMNIILSIIGVAKAVGLVLPEIKGKFIGMVFRVSMLTVLVVDLICKIVKVTSFKEITEAMVWVSEIYFKGYLGVIGDEVVFFDFIHDVRLSIFDIGSLVEFNSNFFKLVSWYDNEWGYSNRVVDFVFYMADGKWL